MLDPTQQPTQQVPVAPTPSYPRTQFNVHENGVLITTEHSQFLQTNQFVPEDMMNAIAGKWLETRKQIKRNMEIVHDIHRTNTPH